MYLSKKLYMVCKEIGEGTSLQNLARGLSRRDHESRYLFIKCAAGLPLLFHGIKVCHGASLLTHMLFVGDFFIFLNVKESEARVLLYTLHKYEKIVGKTITSKKQKFISAKILALR